VSENGADLRGGVTSIGLARGQSEKDGGEYLRRKEIRGENTKIASLCGGYIGAKNTYTT